MNFRLLLVSTSCDFRIEAISRINFYYCYLLQWKACSEKCKKSDGFWRWKGLLSVELTLLDAGSSSDKWSQACFAATEKLRGIDVRIKQCSRNGFLRHLNKGSFIPRGLDFLISRALSFFIAPEQRRSSRDHTPMLSNVLKIYCWFYSYRRFTKWRTKQNNPNPNVFADF